MQVPASVVRAERLLPIFLGALVVGVAVWAVDPYPAGVFHDDGVDVILGKSLATGHLPGAISPRGAVKLVPLRPLAGGEVFRVAPVTP